MNTGIQFITDGNRVFTNGLNKYGQKEILVSTEDMGLLDDAQQLLKYVVNFIVVEKRSIRPDETMSYGSWIIKFTKTNKNYLEISELDKLGTNFVGGADFALTVWRAQHEICDYYESPFSPPDINSLIAYSNGFPNEFPLQCMRYPGKDRVSGWCFITPSHDQNVESLQFDHLFHLRLKFVIVFSYLGLKPGFAFVVNKSKVEKVWFDEEVATRKE